MMSILDEELSSFQWIQLKLLSLDKYWPALVDNTSMSAIGLILASVITVIVTWMLTRDNDASRFRPNTAFRRNQSNRNVTYQDDTSTSLKSRNQKGARTNDTKRNVSAFDPGNTSDQKETSLQNQQGHGSQGTENDLVEDESEFSLISKVKQAKHTAIVKAIKDDLTKEEIEEEKRIQAEQLARIYSLLEENEGEMGKMSYQELQNQMSMYKV